MPETITMGPDGTLQVPEEPVIPFVQGDGTGVDIWPATRLVLDAAAAKHGRRIAWREVLAGQKAYDETGLMPIPESGRMRQPNASWSRPMSCLASGVPSSTSRPA